jgi:hypothetical protein
VALVLLGGGIYCYLDRGNFPKPDDWSVKNINSVIGYVVNNWGPYVMVPAGALFLALAVLGMRKMLLADAEGIGFGGQQKLPWSQVDSLDGRRLQSKGIVVLHAGPRRLVLDSYYLMNFHELIALVERHVPAEKQVLK